MTFVAFLWGGVWLDIPLPALTIVIGGGALVAGIGMIDDLGHVAVQWRLAAHFAAGCWAVFWLLPLPPLTLGTVEWNPGFAGMFVSILWVVWSVNFYNFMDGIDGLAGIEAVTVSGAVAVLLWISGDTGLAWLMASVGFAAAGFVVWNWPPARIFMGDVGSGFLGFLFGSMALITHKVSELSFWVWPILLGVFIVDATVTLCRRLINRKKIHEAHRSHAYQHAVRRYGAHMPVSLAVAAINLLWLGPIAGLVALQLIPGTTGILLAYPSLLVLAWKFDAGA
jgi:Fuc2NAc and GlcNAc transferase